MSPIFSRQFFKRNYGKIFLSVVIFYCAIAYSVNLFLYFKLICERRPFSQGWYHYKSVELSVDQDIYHDLIASIKPNDNATIFISMFLWPLDDARRITTPPYDVELAKYLNDHTHGNIYVDAVNLLYVPIPARIAASPVLQAAPDLNWHIMWQPYALPNDIFMWMIHMPWLQIAIHRYAPYSVGKYYAGFKISSNHQKIVAINNGEDGAWIGSRNFNRLNWNNQDQFVFFTGDMAKVLFNVAQDTIARLNPDFNVDKSKRFDIKPTTIVDATKTDHLARLIHSAELKPILLELIEQSVHIDAEISLLSDSDVISAFNQMIKRQGSARLILDPNLYMFLFQLPLMPNVIAISDLDPKIQIRIQDTPYQMHTKAGVFTLRNGANCYLNYTANWTVSALVRLSYNDLGVLICNDKNVIQKFNNNFSNNWGHATPREKLVIQHQSMKYWGSKLLSWAGTNPW